MLFLVTANSAHNIQKKIYADTVK